MLDSWLASSTRRFYPSSPAEQAPASPGLDVARGERVAFQAVIRTRDREATVEAGVRAPEEFGARVRRVGHVPVHRLTAGVPADDLDGVGRLPGPTPDPLLPESVVSVGVFETRSFWISLTVPADMEPGRYPVTVSLRSQEGLEAELTAIVRVHPAVLPPRTDFPVTNWLYADAISDHYGVDLFGDAFWRVLRPYLDNYAGHGPDMMYVPMITPSLDGVKKPTQLLGVQWKGGDYRFDWTLVRRWVQECRSRGITKFEWTHLFTQWGAAHAPRVYLDHGATGQQLWPDRTGATSTEYTDFLSVMLPELERFLAVEGLRENSYFHLSDEPSGDEAFHNYRQARQLIRKLAPWVRVMDALSDVRFAAEGLVDVPIPLVDHAMEFLEADRETWIYYCTATRGRYVNQELDTPLSKLRMLGWLLHRTGAKGYLHWGYNYWYRHLTADLIDPFQITDSGANALPCGDGFVVYPGSDGPIDSMRWEVYSHTLQDLALLRASGIGANDPLLGRLRDFADFPRDESWLIDARRHVLAEVARVQSG